jgi:hypothetical protein
MEAAEREFFRRGSEALRRYPVTRMEAERCIANHITNAWRELEPVINI